MRQVGFFGIVVLFLVAAALPAAAQDDKTQLTVKVLRESDGGPVADAHIIVHFTEERLLRRDRRGTWETKTNRRGEVMLPNVPTGAAKVQVIARGYQTYGDEIQLTKPEEEVTIHLKPPRGQVSAY